MFNCQTKCFKLTDLDFFGKKVHNPQLELFVAPAEVHVQPVVDRVLRVFGEAESELHFRQWVVERA